MNRNTKIFMLLAIAVPFLITGVAFSHTTVADKTADAGSGKVDKLKKLTSQQQEEIYKLESMPEAQSQEEIDKNLDQGKKVKDIGLEIGRLQEELNPKKTDDEVQERIHTLKRIFSQKEYYRDHINDPENGQRYKKALEILGQKKKTLDQIEKDYKETKKPVEQLLQELDELRAIRELY